MVASPPLQPAAEKFKIQMKLSSEAVANLIWWTELSLQANGAPILLVVASLVVESDASNMGWGATNDHEQTGGTVVSGRSNPAYIDYLELLAMFLALKTFAKELSQCTVPCKSDNITAVTYLKSEGWGTLQPSVHPSTRDLELVSSLAENTDSGIPSRVRQPDSRWGVQNMSRPEQLETQPISVQSNPAADGPTESGPLCILPRNTSPTILQLVPRP